MGRLRGMKPALFYEGLRLGNFPPGEGCRCFPAGGGVGCVRLFALWFWDVNDYLQDPFWIVKLKVGQDLTSWTQFFALNYILDLFPISLSRSFFNWWSVTDVHFYIYIWHHDVKLESVGGKRIWVSLLWAELGHRLAIKYWFLYYGRGWPLGDIWHSFHLHRTP